MTEKQARKGAKQMFGGKCQYCKDSNCWGHTNDEKSALEQVSRGVEVNRSLRAELEQVKAERDRLANDALGALSKYVPTPEKGYVAEPFMLAADIDRLGSERDAAIAERDFFHDDLEREQLKRDGIADIARSLKPYAGERTVFQCVARGCDGCVVCARSKGDATQ